MAVNKIRLAARVVITPNFMSSLDFVIVISSIYVISIYKLGDVGISSNLIGSLSPSNGQCPPPGGG